MVAAASRFRPSRLRRDARAAQAYWRSIPDAIPDFSEADVRRVWTHSAAGTVAEMQAALRKFGLGDDGLEFAGEFTLLSGTTGRSDDAGCECNTTDPFEIGDWCGTRGTVTAIAGWKLQEDGACWFYYTCKEHTGKCACRETALGKEHSSSCYTAGHWAITSGDAGSVSTIPTCRYAESTDECDCRFTCCTDATCSGTGTADYDTGMRPVCDGTEAASKGVDLEAYTETELYVEGDTCTPPEDPGDDGGGGGGGDGGGDAGGDDGGDDDGGECDDTVEECPDDPWDAPDESPDDGAGEDGSTGPGLGGGLDRNKPRMGADDGFRSCKGCVIYHSSQPLLVTYSVDLKTPKVEETFCPSVVPPNTTICQGYDVDAVLLRGVWWKIGPNKVEVFDDGSVLWHKHEACCLAWRVANGYSPASLACSGMCATMLPATDCVSFEP